MSPEDNISFHAGHGAIPTSPGPGTTLVCIERRAGREGPSVRLEFQDKRPRRGEPVTSRMVLPLGK